MPASLDSLDGCTLPTQLTLGVEANPHAHCDRERDAAEREIARLKAELERYELVRRVRDAHELLRRGGRVDLATSLYEYECPGCEQSRPRGECCFEVSPYRGAAFYVCHRATCLGDVLVERFPAYKPAPLDDEDLPW